MDPVAAAEVVVEGAIPVSEVDLAVSVGKLRLASPVLTASGCFASGAEIDRFHDISDIGAVVVKSVTVEPREGLPTPRMAETPSGMLNAIGLQNPGIDAWLARDLPYLQGRGAATVVSVAGKTVEEFRDVARKLRRAGGVVALEVNLSCPNVEHRGLVFATDPRQAAEVIAAVKREADVPVLAKLTSDVTDVVTVATAVVEAGADGLTLINTVLGMAIDAETGRPRLSNTYGGLSGPAIKPIALRNVHQVHAALPDVPIIGCGGARSATDVVEFLRVGASAVQIGTATFVDPFVHRTVTDDLRRWLAQRGITSPEELRGQVEAW
ncbi:MAG: dihydroorotate dehydrogenase [Nitriliruptor sp.]|uniref:dihydroorotate dehydrogenase n=1 Tax=Nitriliruptor sp. TaxID=2448056 RepID=UPI0034A04757